MQSLDELRDAAIAHINDAADGPTLEQLRVDYLGKKGKLTGLLKGLGAAVSGTASCSGRAD